jgi:hypothetical protein
MVDEPRQRRRRTELRKVSYHKWEAQVDTGELDPELDFVCPFCQEIYSRYYGRYKLHLRKCKHRISQTTKSLKSHHPLKLRYFLCLH